MLKRMAIPLIIVGVILLTACSTTTMSNKGDHAEQDHASKTDQSTDSQKTKKDPQQKNDKEAIPAMKPFEPIEPPKDARSLEDNYSSDTKTQMPAAEAHGEDSKRTVPLGQTLLKGKKDFSNGPLKNNRVVAFYGTPKSENMGFLGEYSPDEMMDRLKKQTEAYSKADPERPAIPAIELIATVAQRTPGSDGLYITKPDTEVIDQYAKLAENNGALLILDIQLGQAPVMREVREVESYLKLPHVHLAIDTEYSVEEGEIPGEDLGHVDGTEIQEAVEYVDKLVEKNNLPDKMVLVHQFGNGIVTNKEKIKPTEHVEVPLNYDGFGESTVKMSAYGKLVRDEPIQYGGFKLFYKKDEPLLLPEDVLKLDPAPAIVNYQ